VTALLARLAALLLALHAMAVAVAARLVTALVLVQAEEALLALLLAQV
jgi:hypothetical protein